MFRKAWLSQVATFLCLGVATGQHPEVQISNERITARIYLPDPMSGYYRGTRFDWSGVVSSLTLEGHQFFGEWQKSDDPLLDDRIVGPVESFSADHEGADHFLRIGVGQCAKEPAGAPHPYRVIQPGQWMMESGANWVEMTHRIFVGATQQGYEYRKRLTLIPHEPELVIDHTLTNTGHVRLESEVYNHNFFVIDGQTTGPDFVVRFPFEPIAEQDLKGIAELRGNELTYLREIRPGEQILTLLTGFSNRVDHHRFTIENRRTHVGVHMATDRPMSRLQFWSPHTTLCPEPFLKLAVPPGHQDRWSIRYSFFSPEKKK